MRTRAAIVAGLAALLLGSPAAAAASDPGGGSAVGEPVPAAVGYHQCLPFPPGSGIDRPWGCVWRSGVLAVHQVQVIPKVPTSGQPFLLVATVSNVTAEGVAGQAAVQLAAPSMPVRIAPSMAGSLSCTVSWPGGGTPIGCRAVAAPIAAWGLSGQASVGEPLVITDATWLGRGAVMTVRVPVVADRSSTGQVLMQADWGAAQLEGPPPEALGAGAIAPAQVQASVDLVVVDRAVIGARYRLPASLRTRVRVRTLTPDVCTIARKAGRPAYKVRSHGTCRLRGTNAATGRTQRVSIIV
jgi:hypothetical protein